MSRSRRIAVVERALPTRPERTVPAGLVLSDPAKLEALERVRSRGLAVRERLVFTPEMAADWAVVKNGLPCARSRG